MSDESNHHKFHVNDNSPTLSTYPYKISYFLPGKTVKISGTFWGWGEPQPLEPGTGSIYLHLVPGVYEFKFLVDGQWVTSQQYPTVRTFLGEDIRNNIIVVEPQSKGAQTVPLHHHHHHHSHHVHHEKHAHGTTASGADSVHHTAQLSEQIKALTNANQDLDRANRTLTDDVKKAHMELVELKKRLAAKEDTIAAPVSVNNVQAAPPSAGGSQKEIVELRTQLRNAQQEVQRMTTVTTEVETLRLQKDKLSNKLSEFKNMYAKAEYGLTNEEIDRYRTAFDLFDKDHDGCITSDELKLAITECGLKPTSKWVQDLIREADEDASGTIEWPEFVHAMTKHVRAQTAQKPSDPKKSGRKA